MCRIVSRWGLVVGKLRPRCLDLLDKAFFADSQGMVVAPKRGSSVLLLELILGSTERVKEPKVKI